MRYLSMILMLMLISSVGLTAQTAPHSTATILTSKPASESCPVGFSASRTAAPVWMVTKNGAKGHSSLGLHLNFADPDVLRMVKVGITVHGASGKVHAVPADTASDSDTTETFNVRPNPEPEGLLHSEIWLKKMSAVSWVDLTEIKYANGTVWHASSASKCRAVPNNLLLVANGH